jgi:hypothetical protein
MEEIPLTTIRIFGVNDPDDVTEYAVMTGWMSLRLSFTVYSSEKLLAKYRTRSEGKEWSLEPISWEPQSIMRSSRYYLQ